MDKKRKVLDTNVLIDFPQIVTKTEDQLIIPMVVLLEIDGLKKDRNPELAQKARKAAVYIAKNMANIDWDMTRDYGTDPDGVIIEIARQRRATLVTNDVSCKVRAMLSGVDVEGYSWKDDYTGVKYLDTKDMSLEDYNEVLGNIINTGEYKLDDYTFSVNEYLIVPPYYENERESVFRYDGTKFIQISRLDPIDTEHLGLIKPRNAEQICLFDALNRKVPIVYAGGKYGTGKTFITHGYAIAELEKEKIDKIVYVPNNSYTQNTMDLGALPGDMMEKIIPSIGPLIDIAGIDEITRWIQQNQLEIVPMGYMRGRSFNNSIILVSEAENLTEDHIKLLIARCGEGTRIFFDGDIHQADSAIFKDKNGLKLLLNLHNAPFAHMFATAQLQTIERSEVAAAADYLDNI